MSILKKLAGIASVVTMMTLVAWGVGTPVGAQTPYDAEVQPLTTAECGRCHFSYYQAIRTEGGKHQIDCVQCHTIYHAYSPRKQNYDQIMPKCEQCHVSAGGGPFHGPDPKLVPCLNCHTNPHTPLNIPMGDIEVACNNCHGTQAHEVEKFPSLHSEVGCSECHHDKHGLIPTCDECHENHSPAVPLDSQACMSCHPVHKPTQIMFDKNTDSQICAGCHEEVYNMLQQKVTKHTAVTCADCHPTPHGTIPACSRCHGEPHPPNMKVDVKKCGTCHGIAHDLRQ
jgi:predicted CXXCH cytochrome family protein